MQHEVEFCKQRTGNIWKEVGRAQVIAGVDDNTAFFLERIPRQAGYDVK